MKELFLQQLQPIDAGKRPAQGILADATGDNRFP